MKSFFLSLIMVLIGTSASAIINPGDNVIGPYFNDTADLDCLEGVGMNSQFPIYIILTNPTFGEIYGFELGLDYGSDLILVDNSFTNSEALNVGSGNEFIVGFGSPTYTQEATLLMTISMLFLGTVDSPSLFSIRGSSPSSLDPAYPSVLLADDELQSTSLHSEYRPYNFLINGQCSFDDEETSWDGVKSLYRR